MSAFSEIDPPPAIPSWLLALGIISALTQLVYIFACPIDHLHAHVVVDDTYYYLMIARNTWEVGGLTFDGIHPTNGFQPLWQWLVLPLGALGKAVQLRAMLLLGALLYQLTPWLLLRRATGACATAARGAAVLLWLNPRLLFEGALSGMEFSLYLFLAAWAAIEAARIVNSNRDAIPVALLWPTALLPLARVDGIGLSAFLWAWVLWNRRDIAARVMTMGFASLVPFLVWAIANKLTFDSTLPISGTVKRLDWAAAMHAAGTPIGSMGWLAGSLKDTGLLLAGNSLRFGSGFLPPAPWPRIALLGGGALMLVALLLMRFMKSSGASFVLKLLPSPAPAILLAFSLVQALVYCLLIGYPDYAQWYFGPFYLGMAWWLGDGIMKLLDGRRGWACPAFVVFQSLSLVLLPQQPQRPLAGLRELLDMPKAAIIQPGVRVGAWNAGIVAYELQGRATVINLDGLVNSTDYAHRFTGDHDQTPYLQEASIDYLLDYSLGDSEDGWVTILAARLDTTEEWVRNNLQLIAFSPPHQVPSGPARRYFLVVVS